MFISQSAGLGTRRNLKAPSGTGTSNTRGTVPASVVNPKPAGLRVHITLGFLITATLPGLAWGPKAMATWSVIIFTSLIVHELGHALCGILWGSRATLMLYPLGGITQMDPPLSRRRSIISLLAGPLLNLTLGLCIALIRVRAGSPSWLNVAMWVNLGWGALNLLPVLPFDGGRLLVEALGEKLAATALLISASAAAGIGVSGLLAFQSLGLALVFGAAAFVSFVEWSKRRRVEIEARLGLFEQLELAKALLAEGRTREAQSIAETVFQRARTQPMERAALELLAWSSVALGQPQKAREALQRGAPPHGVSTYCLAAIEDASGNSEQALRRLEGARQAKTLQADAIKLLIDIHARRGDLEYACQVALEGLRVLAPSDVRLVLNAAFADGSVVAATELARALAQDTHNPDDVARVPDTSPASEPVIIESWE